MIKIRNIEIQKYEDKYEIHGLTNVILGVSGKRLLELKLKIDNALLTDLIKDNELKRKQIQTLEEKLKLSKEIRQE